jgi:hypothetical protein
MADKPTNKPELSQGSASRRNLLKKAVYTAPALITLGLIIPENVVAFGSDPPDGPLGGPPSRGRKRIKPPTN